ncbi:MAG: hypothetical protein WD069_16450 [Planctomycetales bacterium]
MKQQPAEGAAEIRRRMKVIRGELSGDIEGIAAQARDLADWKYHVRRHPWGVMAVVAAAGYLFVPRRKEIISPDAATLAKLADQDRLVIEREPKAKSRGGLADMLIAPITAMLLRSAGNYLSMKFGELLQDKADQSGAEPELRAAPPPSPAQRPR